MVAIIGENATVSSARRLYWEAATAGTLHRLKVASVLGYVQRRRKRPR